MATVVAMLASASPAAAEIVTVTHRQGPYRLKPFQVRYTEKETKEGSAIRPANTGNTAMVCSALARCRITAFKS